MKGQVENFISFLLQKNTLNSNIRVIKHRHFLQKFNYTLHPVYSELAYSEYPVITNGFLLTDR
jgi:hypothetical protein